MDLRLDIGTNLGKVLSKIWQLPMLQVSPFHDTDVVEFMY